MKRANLDCFAYRYDKTKEKDRQYCDALKELNCEFCKFYKRKEKKK